MNYSVWVPSNNTTKVAALYNISRYGTVAYRSPCAGRDCDECHTDKNLYRVCPGCGSKLPDTATLYECSCGTAIQICGGQQHRFVHAYITPHPVFLAEEDTI